MPRWLFQQYAIARLPMPLRLVAVIFTPFILIATRCHFRQRSRLRHRRQRRFDVYIHTYAAMSAGAYLLMLLR